MLPTPRLRTFILHIAAIEFRRSCFRDVISMPWSVIEGSENKLDGVKARRAVDKIE